MEIYKTAEALNMRLEVWKTANPKGTIGLVPTMGALHDGHISLVKFAKSACDIVVVSVFVNPTQFNDSKDLERYPRTLEADSILLTTNNCDVLFIPEVIEMYPESDSPYLLDMEGLDTVMEGKFRPGHFLGVCNIVEKLLHIVKPQQAFFGVKDFQQVAIISHMVKKRNLPVNIVACPIKRNDGGLALSSRNALLSAKEKDEARIINWTLKLGKELVNEGKPLEIVTENMLALFKLGNLQLEYLEIVDSKTLQPVNAVKANISACMAAYCGKVRLIDNIQLN